MGALALMEKPQATPKRGKLILVRFRDPAAVLDVESRRRVDGPDPCVRHNKRPKRCKKSKDMPPGVICQWTRSTRECASAEGSSVTTGETTPPAPQTAPAGPVVAANRPDINNCPPDKLDNAKDLCKAKEHKFIPSVSCLTDVCFGGNGFAE